MTVVDRLALLALVAVLLAGCGGGPERRALDERRAPSAGGARGEAPPGEARRPVGRARTERRTIGRSAQGRRIELITRGDPHARPRILVVGCIHGTECEGTAIARRLAGGAPPSDSHLAIVPNLNPDGRSLGTRLNGRGVDLNRNFPSQWRPIGRRFDLQYSGPRPLSEPETRLARRLILRLRPDVTLWFHQPQAIVRSFGRSEAVGRSYARLAGLPHRRIRWPAGTASNWQNRRFPGTASFVIELPPGPLPPAVARRHARAVRMLPGTPAVARKLQRRRERDVARVEVTASCTRIVVDPGHDSRANPATEPIGPGSPTRKIKDGGGASGVDTGTPEHAVTLAVSLELRRVLEARGYCVTMTRTRATGVSLGNVARARIANRARAALFVRVHADGSTDRSRRGSSVLYPAARPRWTDDVLPESRLAAQSMQRELVHRLGSRDLGIVARRDITGFNWSDVPVVLPEIGFLSNPADDRLLASRAYQRRAARALAAGIERFAPPAEG